MPGNVSFDKVYTEKQWVSARNGTGLLGRLTEKVRMGDEFKLFQRDKADPQKTLPAAERLLEKIKEYEKILLAKHAKDRYFTKLSRIVIQQKALLETGIKFAEGQDQLVAKAKERIEQLVAKSGRFETRFKKAILFANHRVDIEGELMPIDYFAKDSLDRIRQGRPGQRLGETVVEKEKELERLTAKFDGYWKECTKARGQIESIIFDIEGILKDKSLAKSKDSRVHDGLERLHGLLESAKRAYQAMETNPETPKKAAETIKRLEGQLREVSEELAEADDSDYKTAKEHWDEVMALKLVSIIDSAINKYGKKVTFARPHEQIIPALFAELRVDHERGFNPFKLKSIQEILFQRAEKQAAAAVKAVVDSGQDSENFRILSDDHTEERKKIPNQQKPGVRQEGPKKVSTQKEYDPQEEIKAYQSLAQRIKAAGTPKAAADVVSNVKVVEGVLAAFRQPAKDILSAGVEIKKAVSEIAQMLGEKPANASGAAARLKELVDLTRPRIEPHKNGEIVWQAIQQAIYTPLTRMIAIVAKKR